MRTLVFGIITKHVLCLSWACTYKPTLVQQMCFRSFFSCNFKLQYCANLFTDLLLDAYVGIHQVRILVFDMLPIKSSAFKASFIKCSLAGLTKSSLAIILQNIIYFPPSLSGRLRPRRNNRIRGCRCSDRPINLLCVAPLSTRYSLFDQVQLKISSQIQ